MPGYEYNSTATIVVFAFDVVTGLGKTGDAANLTLYKKEKGGSLTQVTDTAASEISSTNAPGYYEFDLAAGEIDTQYTHFFAKSSTTSPNNVGVQYYPPSFTAPVGFYNSSVLTNSGIASAVWDENIDSGHQTANSAGKRLDDSSTTVASNLDASVSSRSTLSMSTSLPGSPTADTMGDALKKSSVGIPQSAAGAAGGLATYNNVYAGVIFGTISDVSPTASAFNGDSSLEGTIDNYYAGRFLIFTSNNLGAREISTYTASTRRFTFAGSTGYADAPFNASPANGASYLIFGFHGA